MKVAILSLTLFLAFEDGKAFPTGTLGDPESNILTRDSRTNFIFTGYPNLTPYGHPSNVADEQSRVSTESETQYYYLTKQDARKVAYLKIDLKQKYYVRAFAVNGWINGSYKPSGNWYLEGSNDDVVWKMVGVADASKWITPGVYPFLPSQIVKCIYSARYRYYRVIASGWTNNQMLIENLGLFA